MIHHVDRALEQFLRREAALSEGAIDVSFDAPDRTWGAARTRPTVNCFLWEVVKDPAQLRTGLERRTGSDGVVERRPSPPVIDLHYLVTAWAAEYRDEHQLLGTVLEAVMANRTLPADLLGGPLASVRCGLGLAPYDKKVPGDFWSALDGRLKPGLQVQVTLPVEVFAWKPAGPPAESVGVTVNDLQGDELRRPDEPAGGVPNHPNHPLRRVRRSGAVVMEGRPETDESQEH